MRVRFPLPAFKERRLLCYDGDVEKDNLICVCGVMVAQQSPKLCIKVQFLSDVLCSHSSMDRI